MNSKEGLVTNALYLDALDKHEGEKQSQPYLPRNRQKSNEVKSRKLYLRGAWNESTNDSGGKGLLVRVRVVPLSPLSMPYVFDAKEDREQKSCVPLDTRI